MHSVKTVKGPISNKLLLLVLLFWGVCLELYASEHVNEQYKNFAVVNGYEIPMQIYVQAMRREAKKRYYHARITEERYTELKEDVGEGLIDNALLMLEAERLRLVPDSKKVDKSLLQISKRMDAISETQKKTLLENVRSQFESRERIRMLEHKVRKSVSITEDLAKQFYVENTALFSMPEQRKVSLILLKVLPSAMSKEWQEAKQKLLDLREQLLEGRSFPVLAREYSDDVSASNGGDMGFLHKGMLDGKVEDALAQLTIGGLSQPIRVLEGVVLVRLDGVKNGYQNPYESVKDRVYQLLTEQLADKAWQNFVEKLRANAEIVRNKNLPMLMSR